MKRLSEFRGEEALDVIADLIEPASEIIADNEMKSLLRGKQMAKAAKIAIKNHKRAVIAILAALEREDPETYEPTIVELPMKLLALLNDPELADLFTSQGETPETKSGSASEITEGR